MIYRSFRLIVASAFLFCTYIWQCNAPSPCVHGARLTKLLPILALTQGDEQKQNALVEPILGPFERLHHVAYSGKLLAGASYTRVFVWDIRTGKIIATLADRTLSIVLIAFSADEKQLIALNGDGFLLFWDIRDSKITRKVPFPVVADSLLHATISGNRKVLAYYGTTHTPVTICDVESGKQIGTVKIADRDKPENQVSAMRFSPDGKVLVLVYLEREGIEVRSIPSGRLLSNIRVGFSSRPEFSSNGKYLAVSIYEAEHETQSALIWDLKKEAVHSNLKDVKGVKFSPDGEKLFIWSGAGIRILDIENGVEKQRKHCKIPCGIFAPDGRTMCAISESGEITIWDVDSGQEIMRTTGRKLAVEPQ